jgi:hypothetical protein
MTVQEIVQGQCFAACLDFLFIDAMKFENAVPDNALVGFQAAGAERGAKQFSHGGMIRRFCGGKDISS